MNNYMDNDLKIHNHTDGTLYADIIHKNTISKILRYGTFDNNPRGKYKSDEGKAYSKFITQNFEQYDINNGQFPITTLRPIAVKSAIKEMFWIFQDQSNDISLLKEKYNVNYWDDWDIGNGTIGNRYGSTVKKYNLVNNLINGLKNDPFSRRHIISLWQEDEFSSSSGLVPCAFLTLWSVREVKGTKFLDLTLIQRSNDYIVSGHINMMQYVALQMMVAHTVGMKVGIFSRLTQNIHIYTRHIDDAVELLRREPSKKQPKLILDAKDKSFYDITIDDFSLIDYEPIKPQLYFDLAI